jgi:hypothetical protein
MWDPPSYEGLLYSCCIGIVNLTFSKSFREKLGAQQVVHNLCTITHMSETHLSGWIPSM